MRNVAGLQEALITFVTTMATLGIALVVVGTAALFVYLIVRGSLKP